MEHDYCASMGGVTLRPLICDDIELLRSWRNDRENSRYLRDIGYVTEESQRSWFESYLKDDTICTFAIVDEETVKRVVGSVSIYDFEDGTAEVGKILIGDARAHGRGIGRKAMILAMMIGFSEFSVKTFHAFVEPENVAAYRTYISIGFTVVEEHTSAAGRTECGIANDEESIRSAGFRREDVRFFRYRSRVQLVDLTAGTRSEVSIRWN